MIKINRHKVNCPPKLDSSQRTLVKGDYSHDTVKDALLNIQNSKCCYCEKSLLDLGPSERWVEHFVAKTDNSFINAGITDWDKANAWENLLYACGTCNRSKGATPPFDSNNVRILIDPSHNAIDPEDYIEFFIEGVAIFHKERNGSSLGSNTIQNLKLPTRKDVHRGLRKRKAEIDRIFGELASELSDKNDVMANTNLSNLSKMTSAHQPYASFCRKYILQKVDIFNNTDLHILNQNLGMQIQPITVTIADGYKVIV